MSWLNAALGVANFGVQVSQMSKLEQLRRQGAEAEQVQAVLIQLRSIIFQYNHAAKEILDQSERNPKGAAAEMRLLRTELEESGITPGVFAELQDKEYALETTRLINSGDDELMGSLPPEERDEVTYAVTASLRMPDYDYYLENYNDVREYQAARPIYNELKGRNSTVLQLGGVAVLLGAAMFGCTFGGMFGAVFGSVGVALMFSMAGAIGGAATVGYIGYLNNKSKRVDEFKAAKEIVKRVEKQVDLDRFKTLYQRLGSNYQAVKAKRDADNDLIAAVFADTPMLAA